MNGAQAGLALVIAVPLVVIVVMIFWPNTDTYVPSMASPHRAPTRAFTVAEAHTAMQEHRECSVIDCPKKESAQNVLIYAGHMVPDPRRYR
ncbi:hypothetical protein [Nocardia arizonensis]|uniref:hypothetical protein n=1 Tax=Nocardia arizonensis TaxID=1141647 RepID=UPI0006D1CBFA|nr:hypothetical protein [Nocardia arizonensis]